MPGLGSYASAVPPGERLRRGWGNAKEGIGQRPSLKGNAPQLRRILYQNRGASWRPALTPLWRQGVSTRPCRFCLLAQMCTASAESAISTPASSAAFVKSLPTSMQTAAAPINIWARMHGMEPRDHSFTAPRVKLLPSIIRKKTRKLDEPAGTHGRR